MKKCPTCDRTYADESLTFCLADGALLSAPYDPNATLLLPSRKTEPPPTVDLSSDQVPRKSKLALYFGVAAALGLFAIIGISAWRFRLNTPNRENTNPPNTNSSTATKVSGISFTSDVFMKFHYETDLFASDYRIQLMEMTSFSDGRVLLKFSICNVGSKYGQLKEPHFWYTPPNGQNSTHWNRRVYITIGLESGECEVHEMWNEKATTPFQLTRPFGKLNLSASGADVLGSIDLNKAASQGYIQSN